VYLFQWNVNKKTFAPLTSLVSLSVWGIRPVVQIDRLPQRGQMANKESQGEYASILLAHKMSSSSGGGSIRTRARARTHARTHTRYRSSVTIVTTLRAGRYGLRFPAQTTNFFSSQVHPSPFWGSASLFFNGYWRFSSGMKRPGLGTNSPPSRGREENEWRYKLFLSSCLHGVDGEKFTWL
jgi:hypothetical protein